MKIIFLILVAVSISSCDTTAKTSKKDENVKQVSSVNSLCLVAEKPEVIKDSDSKVYYTLLYGGGDQAFDSLRIIISEFNISKNLKIDSSVDFSSEEDQEKLINCLQKNNDGSYVQDLWLDMKEQLDPEDDSNWTDYDKEGNRQLVKGIYPQLISIENPIANTFKVDGKGAEIKSRLHSNHADTKVTTIKWKYTGGKYIFDKYTTKIIDDYDPAID